MVPTAILAGVVLGFVVRWWAVPIVAVAWAVLIGVAEPSAIPAAAVLGVANGAVGAVVGVAARWAFWPRDAGVG